MTKRTFLAIKIIPQKELLLAFEDIKNILSSDKIKWVNNKNIHLTLKFLGDSSIDEINGITEELSQILPKFSKFEIKVSNFGVFSDVKKPKVLWFGFSEYENLELLNHVIKRIVSKLGFNSDDFSFCPHLTIARVHFIKNTNIITELIEKYKNVVFQTINVSEVIFYESILTSKGSVYKPLNKFQLK